MEYGRTGVMEYWSIGVMEKSYDEGLAVLHHSITPILHLVFYA
jgi:hypothetical protein